VQNIGLNKREVAMSAMRLNPLGLTKMMVSRLGLGMAALGRPGYINLWGSATSFHFSGFDRIVRPRYRSLSG
jgi:hypothetical protein